MTSDAQRLADQCNSAGRDVYDEGFMPRARQIDNADVCRYYYFEDGSGVVWDGDENRAHIIDMTTP